MEFRPYYLSKEWVKLGHSVHILAASFSHVRANQPAPPRSLSARWHEIIDEINYCWFATPWYSGNGLLRVCNIASFIIGIFCFSNRISHECKPNVVIASSTYPLDIWVARYIARKNRAKLIFEVHDLWPLSPVELGGMSRTHPFIRLCQAAEDIAYRDADLVVSLLPKVAKHMESHGLDLGKLRYIPNGIDPDGWPRELAQLRNDVADFIAEKRSQGYCIVGYAGSHGYPNALTYLLDAANLLRDKKIAFVLVGDGQQKVELQRRLEQLNTSNIVMFDPIAKLQVPAFLALLDIAYIGWQRSPVYRFGIAPNKLMDYMMASCAVLHSVDAGNDPVSESGCGVTVPPCDPIAIADGLTQLATMSDVERSILGQRGRSFVLSNHIYPVLAKRFLTYLQEIE